MYYAKYDRKPTINRHREKWAMNDVIDSIGYDRARQILEYYFKTSNSGHPLTWFFYNFDRLDDMLTRLEKDRAWRSRIQQQTRERMESE